MTKIVDFLIDNHPKIKLNDHTIIKIKRLTAKRIIISNVSPGISNNSILVHLPPVNILTTNLKNDTDVSILQTPIQSPIFPRVNGNITRR